MQPHVRAVPRSCWEAVDSIPSDLGAQLALNALRPAAGAAVAVRGVYTQYTGSFSGGTLNSFSLALAVMAHLQSVTPPILPPLSAFADASHPVVGRDGAEAVLAAMRGAAGFGQANTSSVAELFGSMSARLVAFNPAAQVIDPALGGASAFRARGERDGRPAILLDVAAQRKPPPRKKQNHQIFKFQSTHCYTKPSAKTLLHIHLLN